MQTLFEEILENNKDLDDVRFSKKLYAIEDTDEFRKLFFFSDTDSNRYFYQEDQETGIINFISDKIGIDIANYDLEYSMLDYGKECRENAEGEDIEIESSWGNIKIDEESYLDTLNEDFLDDEKVINQLVKAEDFEQEIEQIKKDCLNYIFDMMKGNFDMQINTQIKLAIFDM
jgi:hypothetical protein